MVAGRSPARMVSVVERIGSPRSPKAGRGFPSFDAIIIARMEREAQAQQFQMLGISRFFRRLAPCFEWV
jgi:hypothetical protein